MTHKARVACCALFVHACLAWAPAAHAQDWPWANTATNGFRQLARVVSVPAASEPRVLIRPSEHPDAQRVPDLDDLIGRNKGKAILVADGKGLLAESYAFGVGARRTPLGFSISKSLTALAVGHALCDGRIASLDDRVDTYLPDTRGLSWGNASVHDLLRMSSGAHATFANGHKYGDTDSVLGRAIMEGRMSESFLDTMRRQDEKFRPPGTMFQYNNLDTTALALLVAQVTGEPFEAYFARKVWQPAGAAAAGAWVVNGRGEPAAYQGFSATPQDWVRVGLYVLDQLDRPDTCFGRFMQQATTQHMQAFSPGNGYGYQIWVDCGPGVDFCFVGHGGQYLLFNRENRLVIFQHATNEQRVTDEVLKLMPRVVATPTATR